MNLANVKHYFPRSLAFVLHSYARADVGVATLPSPIVFTHRFERLVESTIPSLTRSHSKPRSPPASHSPTIFP